MRIQAGWGGPVANATGAGTAAQQRRRLDFPILEDGERVSEITSNPQLDRSRDENRATLGRPRLSNSAVGGNERIDDDT